MSYFDFIIKPQDIREGDLGRGLGIGASDNIGGFFRGAETKDIVLGILVIALILYMGGGFLTLTGYTFGYQLLLILKSKWFWLVFIMTIIALSLIS